MLRRRVSGETTVSLFPFLSILSCVIGTLTLLIAGLTAGAVVDPGRETAATEHARLIGEVHDARRQVPELERLIAAAVAVAADLDAAKQEHERLKAKRDEADLAQGEVVRAESRIHELRLLIEKLTATLKALRDDITKLEAELAQRSLDVENAGRVVVLGPLELPGTAPVNLSPTFIECTGDGLSLRVEADRAQQQDVAKADIAASADLKTFLQDAKTRTDATVVCLIRPGGILTFAMTQAVATEVGLKRFAKIPVPGEKLPDLSLFHKRK